MPRQSRKKSSTGIYHVMLKGINKQDIFEEGYCQAESYVYNSSQDEFTFCYYDRDHLGNNREVLNSSGTLQQRISYYPFGAPHADPNIIIAPSLQPYKYNGKELDLMHGLNTYDYGARQYLSILGRWDRIDPLCEKYYSLSPYNYCGNNPIKFVDIIGEKPTPYEAALMAKAVYGDDVSLTGGWERSGIKNYNRENGSGFKAVLYQRALEGGGYEYAYATAGTELTDVDDLRENIGQLFGDVIQYKESINRAQLLSKNVGDSELTFVGHSMGGGLATANALKTGNREAITFNPAALTDATLKNLGLSKRNHNITNYIVNGEIVDYLQSQVGLHPIGNVVRLNASYLLFSDPISSSINNVMRVRNHLINTVINKLDEN